MCFWDDAFLLGPPAWFDEFFQRYPDEVHLPFGLTARADQINEALLSRLKASGCQSIRIGIESANPHLREQVLRKGITQEQIEKAVRSIKMHGILLQTFHIIGIPGETLETALETYEMARHLHPDHAWCSLMQPYPGTEIAEIARQQHLLPADFGERDWDNSYFNSLPLDLPHKDRMIALQRLFQMGNVLRIPTRIMQRLIALPLHRIFDWIFKVYYGLGFRKMNNLSLANFLRSAYYSRDYFRMQAKK